MSTSISLPSFSTSFRSFFIRYSLVFGWLLFTVSLTVWWYIYSQGQLDRLLEFDTAARAELLRSQNMLRLEGLVLVLSLIGGGGTLAYLVFRDMKQSERLRDFFLTLSHELKTPLASLRLQAESIREDARDPTLIELSDRIIADSNRLTVQVENSLFLANLENQQILFEELILSELFRQVQDENPSIRIKLEADGVIQADSYAAQTVLRNIVRNAVTHGKADTLTVSVTPEINGFLTIQLRDNGEGLKGSRAGLGQAFSRKYRGSGSGLGLFLCCKLVDKMGGALSFPHSPSGFTAELRIPGNLYS